MIIQSIRVRNYRSILDETLCCSDLTALVGPNGSGKSTFLRALGLSYSANPKVDPDDFYGENTADEIVVAVTFRLISNNAKELFSSYSQGETMTAERVISWDGTKATVRSHGARLQSPDFATVRAAALARDRKAAYEELRQTQEYSVLPAWTNQTEALETLARWESENPH